MSSEPPVKVSRASVELDRILRAGGSIAAALRKAIDRAALWRFRTGRRQPDVRGVVLIRQITGGRIPEEWWTVVASPPSADACKACGRAS